MSNRRITRPPGGESSDIFGVSSTTTPPSTPRKMKNYMASTIFNHDDGQQAKYRGRPDEDSYKRLFGAKDDDMNTKECHQKTSIVPNETEKINGNTNGENGHANVEINNGASNETSNSNANEKNGHANGTNDVNDHAKSSNGHVNGTNGAHDHANGTKGHSNGYQHSSNGSISESSSGSVTPMTPNGSINGENKSDGSMPGTPSRRIPPGGYSTKLW